MFGKGEMPSAWKGIANVFEAYVAQSEKQGPTSEGTPAFSTSP